MREAIASGKPCMINALVQGGTEVLADRFRKGALELPSRHLEKYAHLNANKPDSSEDFLENGIARSPFFSKKQLIISLDSQLKSDVPDIKIDVPDKLLSYQNRAAPAPSHHI